MARKAHWGKIMNLVKGYGSFSLGMEGLLKISKGEGEMFRAIEIIFIYTKHFWRKISGENAHVTQCKETENLTLACK